VNWGEGEGGSWCDGKRDFLNADYGSSALRPSLKSQKVIKVKLHRPTEELQ